MDRPTTIQALLNQSFIEHPQLDNPTAEAASLTQLAALEEAKVTSAQAAANLFRLRMDLLLLREHNKLPHGTKQAWQRSQPLGLDVDERQVRSRLATARAYLRAVEQAVALPGADLEEPYESLRERFTERARGAVDGDEDRHTTDTETETDHRARFARRAGRLARDLSALDPDHRKLCGKTVLDAVLGTVGTEPEPEPVATGVQVARTRSNLVKLRAARDRARYPDNPVSGRKCRARMYYGFDSRHALKRVGAKSVQAVVTSIPYWGHRTYGTRPVRWEDGWIGDLGMEPSLEQYVAHVVEVFEHVRRVLRKDGVVWLDIGDKQAGGGGGRSGHTGNGRLDNGVDEPDAGIAAGNAMFLPARIAMGLQAAGWHVRAEVIWQLVNPQPMGRKTRPQRVHKTLLMLTKASSGYKYDPAGYTTPTLDGGEKPINSVWEITWNDENRLTKAAAAAEGFVPHDAVFPVDLVKRCLLLTTDPGDWVLDPFMGSGTTALGALRLGRRVIGVDLQEGYADEAKRRLATFDGLDWHLPAASWSTKNRKTSDATADALGGQVWSFNLPAFRSHDGTVVCPWAKECALDCFAMNFQLPPQDKYEANMAALHRAARELGGRDEGYLHVVRALMAEVIDHNARSGTKKPVVAVRLHDSGDFFSRPYLHAWVQAARENPSIVFYGYTKSVSLVLAETLPENFRITFSEGGRQDHLIPPTASRSRVFPTKDDFDAAVRDGWVPAEAEGPGDVPVIEQANRIALLRHNPRNRDLTAEKKDMWRTVIERNEALLAERAEGLAAAK